MPQTASTVRTLTRELAVAEGECAAQAMRRIDRSEIDAVCRHLLGDLPGADRRRRPVSGPTVQDEDGDR